VRIEKLIGPKLSGLASPQLLWGGLGLLLAAAFAALSIGRPANVYVPPPPLKVVVATPVVQSVTPTLDVNGTVVAVNAVDLVARVPGFLQDITYQDGSFVHAGDPLFTIEPLPYQVKLQQAQAAEAAIAAQAKNASIEYGRQSQLGRSNIASQKTVDQALSARDSTAADLDQARARTQLAAINLTYTRVAAPFDGIVTAHLHSVGELVGTTPTVLAKIVQLNPIHVTFNLGEPDVQRIRADLSRRGLTADDLGQIKVEVGLPSETGTPHQGVIDYIAPQVDASTGSLQLRGLFQNSDRSLLPGLLVRVRVPAGVPADALLVPTTSVSTDQAGQYLLVVNEANIVEQRRITTASVVGSLVVVASGLQRSDRVVVGGIQRAVPGDKVDPQPAAPA
jgi:RND family efflux transporter MFP subunit